MATPCLRGLLWKQEQTQNVNWGGSGALGKILSHGLKLLQGARKDWEFGHIWGHPAVPALALTESFLSASLHLQCAGSSLILGLPELGAFLCTSSGTSRHVPVVFSRLVALCCW